VPSLSVVVPATDQPPTLGQCIRAIEGAVRSPEEVIVVETPPHVGPAAARNSGARQAIGEILVFIDSDVEVHLDVFDRIRAAFDADSTLTALFGSYDTDPERHGLVSDFRNLLHHYIHQSGAGPATTFWAGLGAIRRSDFDSIGGFDEARFPTSSVEDIELGMRLAAQGSRIVLDPLVQGKHLKRWSLVGMIKTDLFRRGIPWTRLVLETDSGHASLNLSWRNRAGAATSAALVVAFATRRPRLAAGSLAALVLLNADFYSLLLRKRGPAQAVAGIPLHVLHHIVSVVSVPLAAVKHIATSRTRD
jgi:cellulose synthase/poly-beta-1,6-N-acetylglucosamine synthase-like glycosyltransferase